MDNSDCQFTGHAGAVFAVGVHPDGKLAVSGGEDDTAYLWNIADGTLVRELAKHEDSVVCVAFNRDGKFVATGSMDGIIMVWKVRAALVCTVYLSPHSRRQALVYCPAMYTHCRWDLAGRRRNKGLRARLRGRSQLVRMAPSRTVPSRSDGWRRSLHVGCPGSQPVVLLRPDNECVVWWVGPRWPQLYFGVGRRFASAVVSKERTDHFEGERR